jgi:hypothetical protein
MATFTTKFDMMETVWVIDTTANNQLYKGTVATIYLVKDDSPEYEVFVKDHDIVRASEDLVFRTRAAAVAKSAELFRTENELRAKRLKLEIERLEDTLAAKRRWLKELENGLD